MANFPRCLQNAILLTGIVSISRGTEASAGLNYTYQPGSLILTIDFGYPRIDGRYLHVDGANSRQIIQELDLPSLAIPLINISEQAAIQVVAQDPVPIPWHPQAVRETVKLGEGATIILPAGNDRTLAPMDQWRLGNPVNLKWGNRQRLLHVLPVNYDGVNWRYHRRIVLIIRDPALKEDPLAWHFGSGLSKQTEPLPHVQKNADNQELLARLWTTEGGIYAVQIGSLADSGMAMGGLDPDHLSLWCDGQEIPILLELQNQERLNRGDRFIFQAEIYDDPTTPYRMEYYTPGNVYMLKYGSQPGLRISRLSAKPNLPASQVLYNASFNDTLRIERQDVLAPLSKEPVGDTWDMTDHFFMNPPLDGGTARDYPFLLPGPTRSSSHHFQLTAQFQGITDNTHQVTGHINGIKCFEAVWSGQEKNRVSDAGIYVLNNGFLHDGLNVLTVAVEGVDASNGYDRTYLDWVEITYQRYYQAYHDRLNFRKPDGAPGGVYEYRISGFSTPRIICLRDGNTLLENPQIVPADEGYFLRFQLDEPASSHLYTAVTEDSLHQPALIEIVSGYTARSDLLDEELIVICPETFLDECQEYARVRSANDIPAGVVPAEWIFDAYSYGRHSPYALREFINERLLDRGAAASSVLLVGSPKGRQSSGLRGKLPLMPGMWVQTAHFGASLGDPWYGMGPGSFAPDISIGRIPCRTRAELVNYFQKVNLYYERELSDPWQAEALLIAGFEETFKLQSEGLASDCIQNGYLPSRIYINQSSHLGPYFGDSDSLIRHWERGKAIINFVGHGGGAVWADRSLFTLNSLERLHNDGYYPFVTSMTCFTGDMSNRQSLGNRLILDKDRGAVAVFGSSSVGYIINDYLLLKSLWQPLLVSQLTIGQIIDRGKFLYRAGILADPYGSSSFLDIAHSFMYQYNLLGDPSLKLRAVPRIMLQTSGRSLTPGSGLTIEGLPYPDGWLIYRIFNEEYEKVLAGRKAFDSATAILRLDDSFEPGDYSLTILDGQGRFRGTIRFMVDGSLIDFDASIPDSIDWLDSITISCYIEDGDGIEEVALNFGGEIHAMTPAGDRWFSPTLGGFSAGELVQYNLSVEDGLGNTTFSEPRYLQINGLPDLNHITTEHVAEGGHPALKIVLENRSPWGGSFSILVRGELNGGWVSRNTVDSVHYRGGSITSTVVGDLYLSHAEHLQIIAEPVRPYLMPADTFTVLVEPRAFRFTPALGTTLGGISHDTLSFGRWRFYVPPSSPLETGVLVIDKLSAQIQQRGLIPLSDTTYSITVGNMQDYFPPVEVSYEKTGETGIILIKDEDHDIWKIPPVSPDYANIQLSGAGGVGIFEITDNSSPAITVTVPGMNFYQGGYLGTDNEFTIMVRDESAVYPSTGSIKAWINHQPRVFTSVRLVGLPDRYEATFSGVLGFKPADSLLYMTATDAYGNGAVSDTLEFIVTEKADLFDYGNFPNPFKDLTYFIYELSLSVESFSLEIFTPAGYLVRAYKSGSDFFTSDQYAAAGYHEIAWDGRDHRGEYVANGVYFYQMTARGEGRAVTARGKLVKER